MRETALRDQQIVELGTLAAGTAHELNTPLSTLAILVEELDETATDPAQKEHLRVMMEEIETINERLNRIAGRVGAERSEGAQQIGLRAFLDGDRPLVRGASRHRARRHVRLAGRRHPDYREGTIGRAFATCSTTRPMRPPGRPQPRQCACGARATSSRSTSSTGVGLDPARATDRAQVVSTKERGLASGSYLSRGAAARRRGLGSSGAGRRRAHIHLPLDELLADVPR
jgi:two-component system sensor histidine kinase RegB